MNSPPLAPLFSSGPVTAFFVPISAPFFYDSFSRAEAIPPVNVPFVEILLSPRHFPPPELLFSLRRLVLDLHSSCPCSHIQLAAPCAFTAEKLRKQALLSKLACHIDVTCPTFALSDLGRFNRFFENLTLALDLPLHVARHLPPT